ncbi:MAG: hypothetical protein HY721_31205 [Planctomycetes bacterium]|nr:hypothetical protein [Planctomycetota bacterium]
MPRAWPILLLACALLVACVPMDGARRDPPPVAWRKALDIDATAMAPASGAGYWVAGRRRLEASEAGPLVLLRLDPACEVLWRQDYELEPGTWTDGLRATEDGGCALTGGTGEWASNDADVFVLRIDALGRELWRRNHGGSGFDAARSVAATRDGGLVVGGITASMGAGKSDLYLLKLAASGEKEWERSYGAETWEGQYEDGAYAIPTADGGYVLAGSTDSDSLGAAGKNQVAVYVVKTDPQGVTLWERTFGDPEGFDVGSCIVEMAGGGFAVSGVRHNKNQGLYLVSLDGRGAVLWERTFSSGGAFGEVPLVLAGDGGYLVCNRVWPPRASGGGTPAIVVRADGQGEPVWEARIEGSGYVKGLSVLEVLEGGALVLCGDSAANSSFLVKLGPP